MDVSEFEDLIDRLGEDMSCWPEVQRIAADRLLASSYEARAVLAEARRLRQALAGSSVQAPAGLADRIVTAAKLNAAAPPAEGEKVADPADLTQSG